MTWIFDIRFCDLIFLLVFVKVCFVFLHVHHQFFNFDRVQVRFLKVDLLQNRFSRPFDPNQHLQTHCPCVSVQYILDMLILKFNFANPFILYYTQMIVVHNIIYYYINFFRIFKKPLVVLEKCILFYFSLFFVFFF